MSHKKTILLKLTGELIEQTNAGLNADRIRSLGTQIKELMADYTFALVIGGGNFFRGAQQGNEVAITPQVSHYVGMLATMMNGLIMQDIFEQLGIHTSLFSALDCPEIGLSISAQEIRKAQKNNHCMIFTGGTGNPYFTTDTTAVLRALQINADQLWKGTKVDGIYTKDPQVHHDAEFLRHVSYTTALDLRLGIMDLEAFALAQKHSLSLRVFNIFTENALLRAASESTFGSTIS
ncbi:UMP kinase [Candidatus Dependentiae bacterium]|nr:UMP kinase [Candidatus Dependentiae bacterium]